MSYTPNTWATGNVVTATKLNNLESGVSTNDTNISALATKADSIDANMAGVFSSSTAYSKGDYVIYNDQLYIFTAAHAAGAWTGSDATAVSLTGEVSSLRSDLTQLDSVVTNGLENLTPNATTISGIFINTSGILNATSNADRTICVEAEANKTYRIKKSTSTIMRAGCGTSDSLAVGGILSSVVYHSSASADELTVTTDDSHCYIYVQLFADSDSSSLQSISANTATLVICEDASSEISDIQDDLHQTYEAIRDDEYEYPFTESDLTLGIIKSTGIYGTSGTRFCVTEYHYCYGATITLTIPSGYAGGLSFYSEKSEDAFISSSGGILTTSTDLTVPSTAKYIRVTYAYSDASALSDSDKSDLVANVKFTATDVNTATNEKIDGIQMQSVMKSCYYMDFEDDEITYFTPYKTSPDAGTVYISNQNIIDPDCTFYNNNGNTYTGVDNEEDSTRVRTSSFSIPFGVKYLTLSGVDTTLATLVGVRGFDATHNNLDGSVVIINFADRYVLKIFDNVTNIHLVFGSADDSVMATTVISSMDLMLNIGTTALTYVEPQRTTKSILAWDTETEIGTRYNVYSHNVIWGNNATVKFVYEKTTDINDRIEKSLFDDYITSKFSKNVTLPDNFAFEYYDASNVVSKFTIDTSTSDFMTEVDALVDDSYVTKVSFSTTDDSGTYSLYYYRLNEPYGVGGKPTIFIVCNQHGYEKNAGFSAYWLMDALVNHSADNAMLAYLRNNIDFYIIPLANPWGFNEYDSSVVGTETGYTNYSGININRDYESLESAEAQFVMLTKRRATNPILSIDVHGYGSTRTSDDESRIVWNSFYSYGDLTLLNPNYQFLEAMSPIICSELDITSSRIGILTTNAGASNGTTVTMALSEYTDSTFAFELPMRLPNEDGEFSVASQKVSAEYLINYLGYMISHMKKEQNKYKDNYFFE